MEYLIVSYRSRSHTVKFHEFLNHIGVQNEIINTPKEAGVGCGLSVKVKKSDFYIVKRAVSHLNLNSFAGFFLSSIKSGKRVIKSI
jgi:hypothetical protein